MNIVTIDFDIIMHWSLNIYNDFVSDEENISSILSKNKNANFIPHVDLGLYYYLTQFIIKCIKKLPKDHIFFIDDHDGVVDLFDTNLIKPMENFTIFNIDFHHDIAYDEDDIKNKINDLDCSNWVKYIYEHYKHYFNQYIWINSEESADYDDYHSFFSKKMIIHNINQYNLDALVQSADVLFICKSEEWVPTEQQFLYDVWENIYNEFAKK